MFRRILLATDGSDHAQKAAVAAGEIASTFGSHVGLLYVFNAPIKVGQDVVGADVDSGIAGQQVREVQDCVARRTGHVLETAGIRYEPMQEVGHPGETICRVAEQGRYDLIVVGSRGHGSFQSLLLGSTSDRVVHLAHCPVLVVK